MTTADKPMHTPEPWSTDGSYIYDSSGNAIFGSDEYYPWVDVDSFRRIVQCVNACAGMSDPAADIARLREAAQAVVERWDTPNWKDAEPAAATINRLRTALSANK